MYSMSSGISVLAAQAHGSAESGGDPGLPSLWLQRGLIVCALVGVVRGAQPANS